MNMKTEKNPVNMLTVLSAILIMLFTQGQPWAASRDNLTDNEIANAVEEQGWLDDAVDMNRINVKSDHGIITLTGTVADILTRDRIEAIAATIVGVRGVVNRINVVPHVNRDDRTLRNAVVDALVSDPVAESYEVNVKVDNGVIRATGTVESFQERDLVEKVIKGVKGVSAVDNRIEVDVDLSRMDGEIREEINAALENDIRVDDYLVDVEVMNGKVRLSGNVGSLAEKNIAIDEARVAGVDSVNADALEIEWWTRNDMKRMKRYQDRTDEQIKQAIEESFLYDPRVISANPQVQINEGTVTLKGSVLNVRAKNAAEQDARNVVGVWRVDNHLKVQPEIMPADEQLELQVSKLLKEDPYIERWEIDVNAENGRLYMFGTVDNRFEREHAELVAERIEGVTDVYNNIIYQREWSWMADQEIREEIRDEMFWSVYVDGDDIDISVDRGIVTLEGEVETWGEYYAAEKNAYDGGAREIDNRLEVENNIYGPSYQISENTVLDLY